jgi:hypothetical protein
MHAHGRVDAPRAAVAPRRTHHMHFCIFKKQQPPRKQLGRLTTTCSHRIICSDTAADKQHTKAPVDTGVERSERVWSSPISPAAADIV